MILGIKKERADVNHRPLDLQSNALPLSYTPDFLLQELWNTQILYIYFSSCQNSSNKIVVFFIRLPNVM